METSNGIVHAIDTVLSPLTATNPAAAITTATLATPVNPTDAVAVHPNKAMPVRQTPLFPSQLPTPPNVPPAAAATPPPSCRRSHAVRRHGSATAPAPLHPAKLPPPSCCRQAAAAIVLCANTALPLMPPSCRCRRTAAKLPLQSCRHCRATAKPPLAQ